MCSLSLVCTRGLGCSPDTAWQTGATVSSHSSVLHTICAGPAGCRGRLWGWGSWATPPGLVWLQLCCRGGWRGHAGLSLQWCVLDVVGLTRCWPWCPSWMQLGWPGSLLGLAHPCRLDLVLAEALESTRSHLAGQAGHRGRWTQVPATVSWVPTRSRLCRSHLGCPAE